MLVIIPSYERFRQSGDIPKEQDRIFELVVKHLSVVWAISSAPLFESFLGEFQGVNLNFHSEQTESTYSIGGKGTTRRIPRYLYT